MYLREKCPTYMRPLQRSFDNIHPWKLTWQDGKSPFSIGRLIHGGHFPASHVRFFLENLYNSRNTFEISQFLRFQKDLEVGKNYKKLSVTTNPRSNLNCIWCGCIYVYYRYDSYEAFIPFAQWNRKNIVWDFLPWTTWISFSNTWIRNMNATS